MTPERFETLAEAWGGDVARWPHADREAAAALMAEQPAWAERVLADAGELDAALSALAPPRGASDLADRIAAGAPKARPRWQGWLVPAGMGAGLAAACAAGVMMGAQLGAPAMAPDEPDALVAAVSDEDFSLYLDEEAG
jgi:hypothetical protein